MTSGTFSQRFGFKAPDTEIVVREDAPAELRDAVLALGYGAGFGHSKMRDIVCGVLLRRPDASNWSSNYVEDEVQRLVNEAPWFRVYDLAEQLFRVISLTNPFGEREFEDRLNEVFREFGIGWKMESGHILVRGSESFELATRDASETMIAAGAPTAANEIHEALKDISRRPEPDVTGAIQHAMTALECVAREYAGTTDTLGPIIAQLPLPKPMDDAVRKLWGFTSEQGRHIIEGRSPAFEEAELVVSVASSLSVYLLRAKERMSRE